MANSSSVDRVDDTDDELASAGITTDPIGSESDTSGATFVSSTSGTADGAAPTGAAVAGMGIAAAGSAEGDHTGR
jgi:hypothetical protein